MMMRRCFLVQTRRLTTLAGPRPAAPPPPPPIRVGYTKDAGRGVFASRDISMGELIHSAEPVVAHPTLSKLNKVCYSCLRRLTGTSFHGGKLPIPETGTEHGLEPMFCSIECQQSAHAFYTVEKKADWEAFHRYCSEENVRLPLLAKRLICMVVSGAVSRDLLDILSFVNMADGAPTSWVSSRSLILDTLKNSGVPEEKLVFASTEWYYGVLARMSLNAFRVELLEEESASLLAAAVASVSGEGVCGSAVYILPSMYNHDCDPNVDISWPSNAKTRLCARRDIEEGEELRITYIDASMSRTSRQQLLQEAYHFQCNCPRCRDEILET